MSACAMCGEPGPHRRADDCIRALQARVAKLDQKLVEALTVCYQAGAQYGSMLKQHVEDRAAVWDAVVMTISMQPVTRAALLEWAKKHPGPVKRATAAQTPEVLARVTTRKGGDGFAH